MKPARPNSQRFFRHSSLPAFVMALMILGLVASTVSASDRESELATDFAPETVVATIDGEALTLGELMIRFATLPQPVRDRYSARREGLSELLSDTVANLVVAREASRRGMAEDNPLFEMLMKIQREEVLRDLYARRTVLAEIDQATLIARYREQVDAAFEREPLVRVRHILVTPVAETPPPNSARADATDIASARAKAERIHRQLTEQGADFVDLATSLSEDASAKDGGDIGWKARGDLVPALSKAVFSLAADEVSGVIESELGFHIAQVTERRNGGLVPYPLVEELLFQELVGERAVYFARQAREDRDRLVEAHLIEYFPERLPW